MIFLIYLCHILVLASSDAPPMPPTNVEVDDNLLKWTPADENATHTAQYRVFGEEEWRNVSSCAHISGNFCNVTFARLGAKHGCLNLRVFAQRNGTDSEAVEACSRRGDGCTPRVRLSSRPGSLEVHLGRDNELAGEYEDNTQYRLCYHKRGEPEEFCRESLSSAIITELNEGETYCVKVQFLHYSNPEGLSSCSQCQDIPLSGFRSSWAIIVAVVFSAVVVGSIVAYVIIFHRKKVKQWLQPGQMPECLTDDIPAVSVSSPTEERYDIFHL